MIKQSLRNGWAALALTLAGCTVAPAFRTPDSAAPPTWRDPSTTEEHAAAPASVTTLSDPSPRWWETFNDSELASLIERASSANLDVRISVLRIAEARANLQSAASAGLPHLAGSASYTREQLGVKGLAEESPQINGNASLSGLIDGLAQPVNLYSGAIDASWELDLFGRVRRSVEAAKAATEAAIGERDDALVSLEAEVAQTYARLRAAQASRTTAESDIATERDVLALTESQAKHGLTNSVDVQNALALLRSTEAQLPQYEQEVAVDLAALAVLLGQNPGALDGELATPSVIPAPPPLTAIGLPSGLARRRPDIRAAEANLHQQTANVGVAMAELYPDISLTGAIGQRAQQTQDLTRWANTFYSFGPSISLPIFQGGRLKANIKLAKAEQGVAALQYRKAVLTALKDVEVALIAYRTDQSRRDSLQATVTADQNAVDLSRNRYAHGLANFLEVLTAENNRVQAEQQFTQSSLAVTTDLVTLYKALGGGWEPPAAPPSAHLEGSP
jgi:outer membrane protein, multidrug efflux system